MDSSTKNSLRTLALNPGDLALQRDVLARLARSRSAILRALLSYQSWSEASEEVRASASELVEVIGGESIRRSSPVDSICDSPVVAFDHLSTGVQLILVPGASDAGDLGEFFQSDSLPLLLGRTVVTQSQYRKDGSRSTMPASGVSWNAARSFLQNADLRLPTESEWEHCCRGGSSSRWFWSEEENPELAARHCWWSGSISEPGPFEVGLLAPNPCGFSDIVGNVWEWCEDLWTGQFGSPASRVIRGGCWADSLAEMRCDARGSAEPDLEADNIGFRAARSVFSPL